MRQATGIFPFVVGVSDHSEFFPPGSFNDEYRLPVMIRIFLMFQLANVLRGQYFFSLGEFRVMLQLLETNTDTQRSVPSVQSEGPSGIWSGLVNVFHEHAFELGYSRGVNDVLATFLEATEEFARRRPSTASDTRRLLHAFSEYLEDRVRQTSRVARQPFTDGLGI